MTKSKYTTLICVIIVCVGVLFTLFYLYGGVFSPSEKTAAEYAEFFNTSYVHTLDIQVDETAWDGMLEDAMAKEYISCDLEIDGEKIVNAAIRTKGNSSLSSVAGMDSDRYSFKVEFDHYMDGNTYKGLDKLALNNIIQDTTYMKDYFSYTMMNFMGAYAPLCSYVNITVNGEPWGLYLAVEGIEEAFAERNFGADAGKIYKPDSMSMGGSNKLGDGNPPENGMQPPGMDGRKPFGNTMPGPPEDNHTGGQGENTAGAGKNAESSGTEEKQIQDGTIKMAENMPETERNIQNQNGAEKRGAFGGGPGGNAQDVALQYIDDDPDSYPNIFDQSVFDVDGKDKKRLIRALEKLNAGDVKESVNVDEVLRYFAVHNFVNNFDSYTGSLGHNYYLYEKNGMLSMIAWDYNLAFGAFGGMGRPFGQEKQDENGTQADAATESVNFPIDTPVSGVSMEDRPLLNQLLSNATYQKLYHEYMDTFIAQYFESGIFAQEIDRVTEMLAPYVQSDATAFYTFEEFTAGVQTLKTYCTLRAQSVRGQLNGEIPSTQEEQDADSSSFVDGSQISISDMGSNHMGGMGGGPGEMFGQDGMENAALPESVGEQGLQSDGQQAENTKMQDTTNPAPIPEDAGGRPAEGVLNEQGQNRLRENPQQQETLKQENLINKEKNNAEDQQFSKNNFAGAPINGGKQNQQSAWEQYVGLGISVVALLLGILFAALYRKRR